MFAHIAAFLAGRGYEGHLKMKNNKENFMGSAIFWRLDEFEVIPNIVEETNLVHIISNQPYIIDGKRQSQTLCYGEFTHKATQ
jgi:hypothetical protein